MPNLTYACQPTAFVEAVVVRTPWRRRGIATLMLERLLEDARVAGRTSLGTQPRSGSSSQNRQPMDIAPDPCGGSNGMCEPDFWANEGPRYRHARPGESAEAMARRLGALGTDADHSLGTAANWAKGASGERQVGAALKRLDLNWRAIHDITINARGTNVDHLVIGRAGAFTLNTKYLGNAVTIDGDAVRTAGKRTSYVAAARHEARDVNAALLAATGIDPRTRPALVFVGCKVRVTSHPRDVAILRLDQLIDWFSAEREQVLTDAEVFRLEAAARATTTWPEPPPDAAPPVPPPLGSPGALPSNVRADRPVSPTRSWPAGLRLLWERMTWLAGQRQAVPLVAVRWRRYGKDRVYVNRPDGIAIGYLDRATGRYHVERWSDRTRVRQAVEDAGLA